MSHHQHHWFTPRRQTNVRRGLALGLALLLLIPAGAAVSASSRGTTSADSVHVATLGDGVTYTALAMSDGHLFAGTMQGLGIYDVTDPTRPELLGETNLAVRGVTVEGDHAFVSAGFDADSRIVVLDVSNPAEPQPIAWIEPPVVQSSPPSDFPPQLSFDGPVLVDQGLLYVASEDFFNPWTTYNALNVYDVSDPAVPLLVGQTGLQPSSTNNLVVTGGHVYVGENSYLETVDVSAPSAPLVTSSIETPSSGLAVDGAYLYSGSGTPSGELNVYSLANPARPAPAGTIWARADLLGTDDLTVVHPTPDKSFLIAAFRIDSFVWVDVYDVTPPIRLGSASLLMHKGEVAGISNNSVNDVLAEGAFVYVAQWYAGTRVAWMDYASLSRVTPEIVKQPTADKVVLVRRDGAVSWRFGASLREPSADPIAGKTIRLQRSTNGSTWRTIRTPATNSNGKVSVVLKFKDRGTTYWRWSSAADSRYLAATTSKTRVVVR